MDSYIGSKIIKAEKTTMFNYLKKKYGEGYEIPITVDAKKEVYMVIYPPIGDESKPYISMSPIEVFEKAYRKLEDCEISMLIGDV